MAASCREDIETCIQKGHKFRCRANSSQRSSSSRTSRTSQPGGCEAMRTTYLVAFQPPTTQARTAQPAYIIPSSLRYAKVDLFGKHEKQHLRAVKLLGKQHYFGTPTFVRLAPFSRDRTRNPCMMLCKDVSLNGTIAAAEGARLGAISWSTSAGMPDSNHNSLQPSSAAAAATCIALRGLINSSPSRPVPGTRQAARAQGKPRGPAPCQPWHAMTL